jgi:hypothetical protein
VEQRVDLEITRLGGEFWNGHNEDDWKIDGAIDKWMRVEEE